MTAIADTAVRRGRGRPRSLSAENAILDATLQLLADVGFRGFTVDQVAARASASKATIYRRWPTKENLVIAAFDRTAPLVASGRGKPLTQLVDMIWQFSQFMRDTPLGAVLPALAAERLHNPSLNEALIPVIRARRAPLLELVVAAVAADDLPANTDVELFTDQCLGPVIMRFMLLDLPVHKSTIRTLVDSARRGAPAGRS